MSVNNYGLAGGIAGVALVIGSAFIGGLPIASGIVMKSVIGGGVGSVTAAFFRGYSIHSNQVDQITRDVKKTLSDKWKIVEKKAQKVFEITMGLGFMAVSGIVSAATQISTAISCKQNKPETDCYFSYSLFYLSSIVCAVSFCYTTYVVFRR